MLVAMLVARRARLGVSLQSTLVQELHGMSDGEALGSDDEPDSGTDEQYEPRPRVNFAVERASRSPGRSEAAPTYARREAPPVGSVRVSFSEARMRLESGADGQGRATMQGKVAYRPLAAMSDLLPTGGGVQKAPPERRFYPEGEESTRLHAQDLREHHDREMTNGATQVRAMGQMACARRGTALRVRAWLRACSQVGEYRKKEFYVGLFNDWCMRKRYGPFAQWVARAPEDVCSRSRVAAARGYARCGMRSWRMRARVPFLTGIEKEERESNRRC